MKKINRGTFFIVAIVIALILTLTLCDFSFINIKNANDMRFGIDIRGGVEAIYAPKDLDRAPTESELASVRAILETRLDAENILDREITVDNLAGEVLIRFPWKSDEADFDAQKAIEELGETALLTFRDVEGNILLEGKNVVKSDVVLDQQTSQPVVTLELDSTGSQLFSEATAANIGKQIAIFMDETLISAPSVEEQINGGQAIINGMASLEEAQDLSNKINSGALPFSIYVKDFSIISPTLGSGSLNVMVYAGILALILIGVFMIVYYRLPGFVACIGLLLQVGGQLLAISLPQVTLTLPGIAGIILSIGMGVDTNIIISERIKEEINMGRTLRSAIETGYKRAFSAVFDGNITTLIVAIVLMIFGSGAILSFGYTLLTGIILNFVSGILASKLMVTSLSKFKMFRSTFLYGGRREKA